MLITVTWVTDSSPRLGANLLILDSGLARRRQHEASFPAGYTPAPHTHLFPLPHPPGSLCLRRQVAIPPPSLGSWLCPRRDQDRPQGVLKAPNPRWIFKAEPHHSLPTRGGAPTAGSDVRALRSGSLPPARSGDPRAKKGLRAGGGGL